MTGKLTVLKGELEDLYGKMNEILKKNNLRKDQVSFLPREDYLLYIKLSNRSTDVIAEFSQILRDYLTKG